MEMFPNLFNLKKSGFINFLYLSPTVVFTMFLCPSALALPQYQRLVRQEYGFKSPCSTCHSQGGGSSLSIYGKAFERAGKSRSAILSIAAQIPKGDSFDFGTKLKAKANPNDPKSTPTTPGDWAGKSDIPSEELKSFSPPEINGFSVLEGELKEDQVAKLKEKLGDAYSEDDKYPVFYFGEVKGRKTFVIQYVRVPKLKKTLGVVVNTQGEVVGISFVGSNPSTFPELLKSNVLSQKQTGIDTLLKSSDGESRAILEGIYRGLSAIGLVFGGTK